MSLYSALPWVQKAIRKHPPLSIHGSRSLPCLLTLFEYPFFRRGRFLADDYFTILHGEQWAYRAGALEKEIYRPGDQHFLPRGVAKQYKMPDSAWALEYARGNILSMLPFGVADSLTSTMDFVTIWQTVKVSVRGMVKEFFRRRV